jgi:hypothetical protein
MWFNIDIGDSGVNSSGGNVLLVVWCDQSLMTKGKLAQTDFYSWSEDK